MNSCQLCGSHAVLLRWSHLLVRRSRAEFGAVLVSFNGPFCLDCGLSRRQALAETYRRGDLQALVRTLRPDERLELQLQRLRRK